MRNLGMGRLKMKGTMGNGLLLGCVVVLSLSLQVLAFTCAKYEPNPRLNKVAYPYNKDYSSKRTYFGPPAICDDLEKVNRVFFVPQNGTDKKDVEQQAFASAFGLGAFEKECRVPATLFLCASAFRRCEYARFSPSLPNFLVFPLPRPPSRELCENFVKACNTSGVPVPDCNEVDASGEPLYPRGDATFVIDGLGTFKIPSEDYSSINIKDISLQPAVCPYPLEVRDGHDPPCQIVCPHGNIYSHDEWAVMEKLKLWLCVMSLIMDIWVLLTQISIVERRLFPANLAIAAASVHTVWMIIFVVSGSMGFFKVACKDRFEIATSSEPNGMCGVEGAAIFFSTLAVSFIWAGLAVSLFILVVLEKRGKDIKFLWLPVYVIVFTVPTIFCIIIWATGNFKYNFQFPWCWIDSDALSASLFWTWIGLMIVVVVITVSVSITKMVLVKRRLMSLKRALYKNINILIFCISFTLVYGFHWTIWIWLKFREDEWTKAYTDWVVCNAASGGRNNCHLRDQDRFQRATFYFYVILTTGSGFFLFLAWGCSPQYFKHWKRLLTNLFSGRLRELTRMSLAEAGVSESGSTKQGSKSGTRSSNSLTGRGSKS